MGACGSKPKESDIVEGSVPTENLVVESKNETTETETTLPQEKKEESSDKAIKAEPTPEAVKEDEKVPSETEPPTQETAPVKTDEAPLVIL